jgi:hypothetical protein
VWQTGTIKERIHACQTGPPGTRMHYRQVQLKRACISTNRTTKQRKHKRPEVVARMHGRQEKEIRKQLTREYLADQKNSRRNNASETGAGKENVFQTEATKERIQYMADRTS